MAILIFVICMMFISIVLAQKRREKHAQALKMGMKRHAQLLAKVERLKRLEILKGLLLGQKCKGCSKMVLRDELKEAGEDSKGRPIMLCKKCRHLIGMDE